MLVLTASVGAGHNSAARAIVEGLSEASPDIQVECLDVLTLTPWFFRMYYAGGYATTVTRFPFFYGLGYKITNIPQKPTRSLPERRRLFTERLAMRRVVKYVRKFDPDLIVHTHFLAPPLLGRLIDRNEFHTPQFVAVTDNEVHRFWYSEHVDRWFVPAEFSVEPLRRWGIDEERITVSGIPIHPKWDRPLDRAKILSEWNLPTDKQIVILSGGAEFTCAPVEKIACNIVDSCENACVVVLGGRNKKLLGRLCRLSQKHPRIIGISFTDRVHELVEVCSLMVTKAGGITTAECLAKGTPMVILKPVPGQEAGNAAYFTRQDAAITVRRAGEIAPETCRLLNDPAALEKLSANARRLHRPARQTIVDAICRQVR